MQPISIASSSIPVPHFLSFTSAITSQNVLAVLFTVIFVWWVIFTLVAAYHLLRYGRESWLAVPAVALHLAVSGWIFVFATGGFH